MGPATAHASVTQFHVLVRLHMTLSLTFFCCSVTEFHVLVRLHMPLSLSSMFWSDCTCLCH